MIDWGGLVPPLFFGSQLCAFATAGEALGIRNQTARFATEPYWRLCQQLLVHFHTDVERAPFLSVKIHLAPLIDVRGQDS